MHARAARDEGGLDYAWRVSQLGDETVQMVGSDPLVQASVFPAESPAGPGWIVQTRLPVTGDLASRARWCNERNAVLFAPDTETAGLLVPGGWGLSPDGECCLTSWLPPFPGFTERGRVTYLWRVVGDHQIAVQFALARTEPGGVTSSSAAHAELAVGLARAVTAFRSILEYPADFRCEVESGPVGVTLTLSGSAGAFPAFAETINDSERTVVLVPASANRTELAIAYAALLGHSTSRVEAGDELDLVPGELSGWKFPKSVIFEVYNQLIDSGVVELPDEGPFTFPAERGQGRFWTGRVPSPRLHGAEPLQICGELDGLTLTDVALRPCDTDVLGTWFQLEDGVRYQVIVPPAGLLWNSALANHQLLSWLCHHVIRQVQSAAEAR